MSEIQSRFICEVAVAVHEALPLGQTPMGKRHVATVKEGRFEGPELRGRVLAASGGDWLLTRGDGAVQLDARLVLRTDDDAHILMTYRGIRHGPPAVMQRLAHGEDVHPSDYYFRIAPFFETDSPRYDWLNRIVAVATGRRFVDAVAYRVFQVL